MNVWKMPMNVGVNGLTIVQIFVWMCARFLMELSEMKIQEYAFQSARKEHMLMITRELVWSDALSIMEFMILMGTMKPIFVRKFARKKEPLLILKHLIVIVFWNARRIQKNLLPIHPPKPACQDAQPIQAYLEKLTTMIALKSVLIHTSRILTPAAASWPALHLNLSSWIQENV